MTARDLQDLGYGIHIVPLTRGKFAVVDSCQADAVAPYNWFALHIGRTWYAVRNAPKGSSPSTVYMHRMLLGYPSLEVDHINLDGLDNRLSNLRVASHAENNRNKPLRSDNKSGAKGVTWDKERGKWFAKISCAGRQIALGRFDYIEDAKAAYDRAAVKIHGDFARSC